MTLSGLTTPLSCIRQASCISLRIEIIVLKLQDFDHIVEFDPYPHPESAAFPFLLCQVPQAHTEVEGGTRRQASVPVDGSRELLSGTAVLSKTAAASLFPHFPLLRLFMAL